MLDFRPRVQARNYLSRREQRRLLAWVMGIGLVLIACFSFNEIRQLLQTRSIVAAHPVDTRFQPNPAESGEPDAVSIVKSGEPTKSPDADQLPADVSRELLGQVRDDTPWIRNEEIDAWLDVWNVLARSNDQVVTRRSADAVGFVELFSQPQAFRGKLITIRGSARQAVYLNAAENSADVAGYYRVVVLPEGGPAEPLFLYTLELPRGFPVGEEIRADIAATGYFFKRMVYPTKANSELRRAPVVMSRTITWEEPTVATADRGAALVTTLIGATVLGVIGLIIAGVWAARSGVSATARLPARVAPIDDREVVDVRESLATLAENHE